MYKPKKLQGYSIIEWAKMNHISLDDFKFEIVSLIAAIGVMVLDEKSDSDNMVVWEVIDKENKDKVKVTVQRVDTVV